VAVVPGGGAPALRRIARLALAGALLAVAAAGQPAALDLDGTWHVLVHYRDASSGDPAQLHWEDRLWVFERVGDRLRWTEYPIVIFRERSGRFEPSGGERERRVLGAWEPSQAQLEEIRQGLAVEDRGRRSKSLRPRDGGGFGSRTRAAPASSSVLTYTEDWIVEAVGELPVFRHEDRLASGRTDTMEGVTVWAGERAGEDGALLVGRFTKDATRRGSFRMRRSGPVRSPP
jgi:hypothetical protein